MAISIISQAEKKLLGRKEITAELDYDGTTPKKEDVRKMIASKVGSDENLVVVKVVKGIFGKQKARVHAVVYDSAENLDKLEKTHKKVAAKPEEKKGE